MGKINIFQEAERCLMCQDAPCGKKVADAIRAIRFENPAYWATSA
jgi:NADPH-dependent glutamate synthase beta subunit-like oxidoreductase